MKASRVLLQFQQAVSSKMEKKADGGYYSRTEAQAMAVFPSPVKRDGNYCLNAMLQCKGVDFSRKVRGMRGIVSMKVQSLRADFVYPCKVFHNQV